MKMGLRFAARSMAMIIGAIGMLSFVVPARAHDNRPAYLQIDEVGSERYKLMWRLPIVTGQRMPLSFRLPDDVRDVTPPSEQELSDAVIEQRFVEGKLTGKRVEFVWLETKRTDVLVRTHMLDGTQASVLVQPNEPWVDIVAPASGWAVLHTYMVHGVDHILFGADHLIFVLGLILIVPSVRMLLVTVTGFTLAHSITLSLATLGVIYVPGPPVEACIALSIMLLAKEVLRLHAGERSLTATYPWAVAFVFGLLHGLGFASGLIEIGLPQDDIPLALFAFNVGVEAGQLAFIAVVLSLARILETIPIPKVIRANLQTFMIYGIGATGAFWFVDRLGGLVA